MLDYELIAIGLLRNPDKEYDRLKKAAHNLVEQGRTELLDDKYSEAKKSFALGYQSRCCCDWIWTHKLYCKELKKVGRPGNKGHAVFVQKSRKFAMLAARIEHGRRPPLTKTEKQKIREKTTKIHDLDMPNRVLE